MGEACGGGGYAGDVSGIAMLGLMGSYNCRYL